VEGVSQLEESIFKTIQGMLGPDSNYTVFDPEIAIHINSAIATLTQLGVGPSDGFRITGPDETWSDFIGNAKDLDSVKTYIYAKVKMVFDPPSSSFVMTSLEKLCNELEWRLNVAVDPGNYKYES
jgi:hypothetical protein